MGELLDNVFLKSGAHAINVDGNSGIPIRSYMGIILFDANVNSAPESNQYSSLWLYMSSINGINTGYTDKGVSVIKIASLKHDFGQAITECSLVGSTESKTITISKGGFTRFSYLVCPIK